ncbi:hypothetical protein RM572_17980 [Streptomyces sp. DSM 42041]|uniref:Lipoprotein n=1 Tax=Streptomyces hazeniae TaxID=3075538 RepID=A0ABU2NUJ0_9ACTN|nr:hypothetical protein [Streptomyces sp. DSM 42041]MDT0380645.1 hypothetical protein [Streptomyces sp. DSM 42041]
MRTTARVSGAAAVIAAALLLTGCGSDGGGENSDKGGAEQSSGEGGASALKGAWLSGELTDRDHKILVFVETGGNVNLSTEDADCTGTYAADADPVTLEMVCAKGSGFEKGTVESVDGDTLTLAWESGGSDTFTRAESSLEDLPTEMPSDLPTEEIPDLPSDLPSGLPE